MSRKKHNKESIITTLQSLAARLKKDTLAGPEVAGIISLSALDYHFGGLGNALEAAGLKRTPPGENLKMRGKRYSDDELFLSLLRVEEHLGRVPKCKEYNAHGDYSYAPFLDRFGKSWPETLKHYDKWKKSRSSVALDLADATSLNNGILEPPVNVESREPNVSYVHGRRDPAQFYGEPIDFRGLRHAPINEQGVVYLFGMVSHELGFYIEAIQQGFPDCEGKYLHDRKRNLWAKARIEFEFRASSFKEHGHDSSGCDFVVCWINDWPDCPLSVIELQKEILKLPAK
jgi:hypothetical protein